MCMYVFIIIIIIIIIISPLAHEIFFSKQPYRDPAEEVVSVCFQTNSGMVEWMNQWMNDIKHTSGFVYSLWFTCKKGSEKANCTKIKEINIVSVPDQRRWTRGLSWCEYTLTKASINYAEQWKITSES